MKIHEIVLESSDTIKTYLGMHGFQLDEYFSKSERLKNVFMVSQDSSKEMIRSNMFYLTTDLYELLSNPVWENLADDPDYDAVYTRLYDLYESNLEWMKRVNR